MPDYDTYPFQFAQAILQARGNLITKRAELRELQETRRINTLLEMEKLRQNMMGMNLQAAQGNQQTALEEKKAEIQAESWAKHTEQQDKEAALRRQTNKENQAQLAMEAHSRGDSFFWSSGTKLPEKGFEGYTRVPISGFGSFFISKADPVGQKAAHFEAELKKLQAETITQQERARYYKAMGEKHAKSVSSMTPIEKAKAMATALGALGNTDLLIEKLEQSGHSKEAELLRSAPSRIMEFFEEPILKAQAVYKETNKEAGGLPNRKSIFDKIVEDFNNTPVSESMPKSAIDFITKKFKATSFGLLGLKQAPTKTQAVPKIAPPPEPFAGPEQILTPEEETRLDSLVEKSEGNLENLSPEERMEVEQLLRRANANY